MNGAPFRHIGGMVICDHGPLQLPAARALASFYGAESRHWRTLGVTGIGDACRNRSVALEQAITEAEAWRRAAGWAEPDAADRQGHWRSGQSRKPSRQRRG